LQSFAKTFVYEHFSVKGRLKMPTLAPTASGESSSNSTVREALMHATLFKNGFSGSIMS
jgi:hypothetical protein